MSMLSGERLAHVSTPFSVSLLPFSAKHAHKVLADLIHSDISATSKCTKHVEPKELWVIMDLKYK